MTSLAWVAASAKFLSDPFLGDHLKRRGETQRQVTREVDDAPADDRREGRESIHNRLLDWSDRQVLRGMRF